MRYILTGDHWSATEAYRMLVMQDVAPSQELALAHGVEIVTETAACGPLGIKTSLALAHLAIDTQEAGGRPPVYRGT